MPLEEYEYKFRAKCSDSRANPLVDKTTAGSIFLKQTPHEHDMDVATNGTAVRLPKTDFARGFELSAETAAMLAEYNAFELGKMALSKSKTINAYPYKSRVNHTLVNVWPAEGEEAADAEEEGEEGEEQAQWPRVEERTYTETCFHDMQAEIDRLARLPGTVPRDIMAANLSIYRSGWATAVNRKYLTLTEAQQERKANAGSFVPWQTMTHIQDGFSGDYWIQEQLAVPELRDKRSRDVQREGALANLRHAIYCLSLCAFEARQDNKGFDWESNPAFTITDLAKEHWKDAGDSMNLFKRMATRFCDANERDLCIRAVLWEMYHNKHHAEPKHYLQLLDSDTDEDPKINEFLTRFNSAEMSHIKANAAKAWQRARVFFLFKGSISGLGCNARSNHTIRVLIDWWRSFTHFQQLMRKQEAEAESMEVPEDQQDFQAELISGEDGMTWEKLPQEQKDEANRLWKVGVENCRAQAVRDNEARFRAEEEKRRRESEQIVVRTTGERSVLAFPKPSALEAFAVSQFERHNPEFKKREEAKRRRAEERALDKNAGKRPKKAPAAAAAASASSSSAASSSNTRKRSALVEVSDESDEEGMTAEQKKKMYRNLLKQPKNRWLADLSDEDDDN